MQSAPLWRRLAAMTYDSLVLLALWILLAALLMLVSGGRLADADRPGWLLGVERIGLLITTWGFFTGFWTHGGQTVGMRAWRLKLVTTMGERVGLKAASLRLLAALLSIAPAGLGYFWALIDREGRTWHDRLSGTRVIVAPKES